MALDYCYIVYTCPVIPVMIVIILAYIIPYSMTYFVLIYVIILITSWSEVIFILISLEHNQHILWALIRCMLVKSNFFRSCIDHFVWSEDLCDIVESYSALQNGDNVLDHNVVSFKLFISVTHNNLDVRGIDKLLWKKATTFQLIKYPNNLDELLCYCDITDHVLQCDDAFCDIHQHSIQEYHDNIVKVCIQAISCILSSMFYVNTKRRSGWVKFVSAYQE